MAVPPCLYGAYLFRAVLPHPRRMCRAQPNCACAPGLAHKTKHAMTKHLALFASLGRLTLSLHISGHRFVVGCRLFSALARRLNQLSSTRTREVNQRQLDARYPSRERTVRKPDHCAAGAGSTGSRSSAPGQAGAGCWSRRSRTVQSGDMHMHMCIHITM